MRVESELYFSQHATALFIGLTAGAAPKLLEELADATLVAPEKATLSCRISAGDPAAEMHWYRDGKEIFKSKRYEMTRDGDTASLVIAATETTDSATYRCEAVNKLGKVKTECSVVVHSMYFYLNYIN